MRVVLILLCAAVLLTSAAKLRGPEYDEAYSIFLTAGDARPAWPTGVFHAEDVLGRYEGQASLGEISHDLRNGDVHPPLYFWALEFWRRVFGPSWLAARMLSVVFSICALAALAWLAALADIPVASATLIALLSYGFAYTGIVARGFALAEFLNIFGVALIFAGVKKHQWSLALLGGLALGAASFSNYLASFVGLAVLLWLLLDLDRRKAFVPAAIGFALFLPPNLDFFLAQRGYGVGQFTAFSPIHAIALLAKDAGAVMFGGLPVYAGKASGTVTFALAALFMVCTAFIVKNWRPGLSLFALASVGPPIGLLTLGFIFNNTPIEIRYLSFSMPFMALLFAAALPPSWVAILLGFEACGIIGLIFAPATMQPQGPAAHQAATMATAASLILLPFGNDGVGIPGPFIAAVPEGLRLELIRSNALPKLNAEHLIVVATISIDSASRKTNSQFIALLTSDACWRRQSSTNLTSVFVRTCPAGLNSR
jgi:hypothetical protein